VKRSSLFVMQLLFHPAGVRLHVGAGVDVVAGRAHAQFLCGLSSGLTFDWLIQVWQAYSPTVWLSLQLALACAVCVCVIGVPAAYAWCA